LIHIVPSGGELDEGWKNIESAWTISGNGETKLTTLINFNLVALAACRTIWAQFNPILMSFGLLFLGTELCATWSVYLGLSALKGGWNPWLTKQLIISIPFGIGGVVLGSLGHLGLTSYLPAVDTRLCYLRWIVAAVFNHLNFSELEHFPVDAEINPRDPHTSRDCILIQLFHFLGG
jgi:hypothetical protein